MPDNEHLELIHQYSNAMESLDHYGEELITIKADDENEDDDLEDIYTETLEAQQALQTENHAVGGLNLENADLHDLNLSNAPLDGVNLSGSNLRNANLTGAMLTGAKAIGTDFSGAEMDGVDVTSLEYDRKTLATIQSRRMQETVRREGVSESKGKGTER